LQIVEGDFQRLIHEGDSVSGAIIGNPRRPGRVAARGQKIMGPQEIVWVMEPELARATPATQDAYAIGLQRSCVIRDLKPRMNANEPSAACGRNQIVSGWQIQRDRRSQQEQQRIGSVCDISVHQRSSAASFASPQAPTPFKSTPSSLYRMQHKIILPQMNADARKWFDTLASFVGHLGAYAQKATPLTPDMPETQHASCSKPHKRCTRLLTYCSCGTPCFEILTRRKRRTTGEPRSEPSAGIRVGSATINLLQAAGSLQRGSLGKLLRAHRGLRLTPC